MKLVKASNNKTRIILSKSEWLKMGQQAGWDQDVDAYYSQNKNLDPNSSDFIVDMRVRKTMPSNLRKKANNQLGALTHNNYFESYPLERIEAILESIDAVMVQEDGTRWSGIIAPTGECGDEKNRPFSFDIAFKNPQTNQYVLANNQLVTTLCTMPSGKLELVNYIS